VLPDRRTSFVLGIPPGWLVICSGSRVQSFYNLLIPGVWIAWFIYWKVAAANVKATVRRESVLQRGVYWTLLIVGASFFTVQLPGPTFLYNEIYSRSLFSYWVGVLVLLLGFACTAWARVTLGRNWSSTVTMKEQHELIQTGPYAFARHPIYTGLLIMFLGTAITVAEWRGLFAIAFTLASFLFKLRIEERYMIELFGPAYEAYRKRVAMLIPWVW
jgi:protein-S-isoprenylcysteine O-methyltransferase Ste14